MKNLFLAISLIVFLFIIFRYFKKFKINSFYAIVVNYWVCVITGLAFLSQSSLIDQLQLDLDWVRLGIYTGALFPPSFYLMALTVEKVSISVATVANKMSLILPVLFSIIFLKKGPEHFSIINISGIALALLAIVLSSIKNEDPQKKESHRLLWLLPIGLFVSGGVIDTLINYTNYTYLKGDHQAIFSIIMFAMAAFTGTILMIITMAKNKNIISFRDIIGGIILGIPNFFSLFFLLRTLSDFNNDAAIVFPVVNIGTIVVASLTSVILFNEKLSKINLIGVCFSLISIILVFW